MDNKEAIAAALQKVLALVNGADVGGLPSLKKPAAVVAVAEPDADDADEAAATAECADCKAGTCTNPEHMSDEDADALAASLK